MSDEDDARNLPASLQVGKKGITEGTILEIKKQLKHSRFVKIKMLRSFRESTLDGAAQKEGVQGANDSHTAPSKREAKHELARHLAAATNSRVASVVGFTIVLERARSE